MHAFVINRTCKFRSKDYPLLIVLPSKMNANNELTSCPCGGVVLTIHWHWCNTLITSKVHRDIVRGPCIFWTSLSGLASTGISVHSNSQRHQNLAKLFSFNLSIPSFYTAACCIDDMRVAFGPASNDRECRGGAGGGVKVKAAADALGTITRPDIRLEGLILTLQICWWGRSCGGGGKTSRRPCESGCGTTLLPRWHVGKSIGTNNAKWRVILLTYSSLLKPNSCVSFNESFMAWHELECRWCFMAYPVREGRD